MENNHERYDDIILADICDGQFIKTHPIFQTDRNAIQIMAYHDEIEVANPLGYKASKHKLGILLCLFLLYIFSKIMFKYVLPSFLTTCAAGLSIL